MMNDHKENNNEVILHVGLHKTGTTSIQETFFLNDNNRRLEDKGYIYPKCWTANHSASVYSAFCDDPTQYHANIRSGASADQIKYNNERYLKDLKKELEERGLSKLIVSGEDISLLSLDNLNALKAYLIAVHSNKIKVMIYVRDPLHWAISTIQQFIKNGRQNYQSALALMKQSIGNLFEDRIGKFMHVFGSENVRVYSFEEAVVHDYGPVGHFLSVIGMNPEDIAEFNIVKANESISLIAGEIISYINERMPFFIDGKMNEDRANGDIYPFMNVKGSKFDIDYTNKQILLENSQSSIEWLKKNWGIDYSSSEVLSTEPLNSKLSEERIEEIVRASMEVSATLKNLAIEYIQIKQP
ncbi:hypothetical protein [Cohnella yongneupensis]|uniref:Sulfotransferase domain-containing protein n=1 Tax=Cohnella yongneupensis TaxID=425006 RepID=A0ABW0QVK5_9BACL